MPAKSNQKKWTPALIKHLRGKRTQEEFAQLLGAPKNTVWRWEAGYTVPAPTYAKKLSAMAAEEQFLSDWKPVGSVVWVGNLDAGAKEIAADFYRSFNVRLRRSSVKSRMG